LGLKALREHQQADDLNRKQGKAKPIFHGVSPYMTLTDN
jgi:hypothetical protein